jgi:molybdenum cofactor biosynthesis protein B
VSTSRYRGSKGAKKVEDESGDIAEELIGGSGGRVQERLLLPDDSRLLKRTVSAALGKRGVDVIFLTGGTGVSTTDVTIESLRPLFEKEIEGFGDVFRFVSFQKIGAAAALSRATAGLAKGKLIICLPGSPDAVRTGLELFLGEVHHVLSLARGR